MTTSNRPLRIALVSSNDDPSGAKTQHRVAEKHFPPGKFEFVRWVGVPWRELLRRMKRRDVDVIHVQDNAALRKIQMLAWLARRTSEARIPVIASGTRLNELGWREHVTRWALKRCEKVLDVACVPHPASLRSATLSMNGEGVGTIPPSPFMERGQGVRLSSQVASPIVCIGRFDESEALKLAVWAFDVLKYTSRDLHLHVIGAGPKREEVEALSQSLGEHDHRVKFLGTVQDVHPHLADAQLVWMTKPSGGLWTVLEAMSLGKPVLALPNPDLAELIREGETGWFVGSSRPVALAEKSAALLKEPDTLQRVGEQGREWVRQHFRAAAVAEALATAYDALVAPPHT